ncbi:hypothetical protein QAD02_022724 [Eretmocerus hayati]|uniref:Uncharacterized protein n=1 Tax=Eretmocerus hayati TaxID=131215 RepID=A0ACC2PU33_9HYME|nr:hypothetical protein QAD02_022724 [Eretmocerus hayati]
MGLVFFVVLAYLAISINASLRIYDGTDAVDGQYPFVVSLRVDTIEKNQTYLCVGSILDSRFILTAAHCLRNFKHDALTIVAGSNLLEGGSQQTYKSEYLVMHEKFQNIENDIGIIRVDRDIDLNDKVQPVKLFQDKFEEVDYPVILTGWGDTNAEDPVNRLQQLLTTVVDLNRCRYSYDDLIKDTHLCTSSNTKRGACVGDSGSPVIADGTLIAIFSFVDEFCGNGSPEVNTRIYPYLQWIEEQLSSFQN